MSFFIREILVWISIFIIYIETKQSHIKRSNDFFADEINRITISKYAEMITVFIRYLFSSSSRALLETEKIKYHCNLLSYRRDRWLLLQVVAANDYNTVDLSVSVICQSNCKVFKTLFLLFKPQLNSLDVLFNESVRILSKRLLSYFFSLWCAFVQEINELNLVNLNCWCILKLRARSFPLVNSNLWKIVLFARKLVTTFNAILSIAEFSVQVIFVSGRMKLRNV